MPYVIAEGGGGYYMILDQDKRPTLPYTGREVARILDTEEGVLYSPRPVGSIMAHTHGAWEFLPEPRDATSLLKGVRRLDHPSGLW